MILVVPIIFLIIAFHFDLLNTLAPLSKSLHEICLQQIPSTPLESITHYTSSLTPALLCAEPIHSESLKQLFIRSSLYHLVVVSATHLTILTILFTFMLEPVFKTKKSTRFRWILIGAFSVYSLMCLLQAPIVRAVVFLLIQLISQKLKLGVDRITALSLSTLICLTLHPLWADSLSLLLSSVCALVFIVVSELKLKSHHGSYLVYFAIIPFLWGWGSFHPLGIVINILIAPVISLIWIPFAILICIIPGLTPLYETFLKILIQFLKLILDSVPNAEASAALPIFFLWILFWSEVLIFKFYIQRSKQCA